MKNIMIERIINILEDNNIRLFLINEDRNDTEELFFVKKKLDIVRNNSVTKYEITVYKDFKENEIDYRGSASCIVNKNMTDEELNNSIVNAYKAAESVKNLYYSLPLADKMFSSKDNVEKVENIVQNKINAFDIANTVFSEDIHEECFVNSLEIFITESYHRIINSNGINVSYKNRKYTGEFVIQCIENEDVEIYQDFQYSENDDVLENIRHKVKDILKTAKDRSIARNYCKDMVYDSIIIEGGALADFYGFYLNRSDASMIYPGYSKYSIDKTVVNNGDYCLNINLVPKVPYSREGIRLVKGNLIDNNVLKCIIGNSRFSFYLGQKPMGQYESYEVIGEGKEYTTLKDGKYLRVVNFSDFQMDTFTGQFGGEYRLAYYFDGEKEIPVTGGSISDNLTKIINNLEITNERQSTGNYSGPLAVKYYLDSKKD